MWLTFSFKVNPMHRPPTDVTMATMTRHARPTVVAADRPLVVPMLLRISDLKLRGIVVLSVSRTKGITLVFKNDPLESITIGSTFDALGGVRDFLQHEIEKQLRNLFQEDLPVMIHHLSLRRLQQQQQQQQQELDMQQRAPPTPTTATASVIPGSPSTSTSSVSLPPLSDVDEYDCDDDLSLPTPTDHTFNWYQKDGLFKDDTPMAHHELLYQRLQQQQEDALSETGSATTLVESMADFYAEDDPDAPWYVVEGMEDPASPAPAMVQTPQFTEKIELRPHENSVVARFSDLTRAHHTLAMDPFTPHNTVFRSTPATSKCTTPSIKSSYHRTAPGKLPKRRVIRLAGFTA